MTRATRGADRRLLPQGTRQRHTMRTEIRELPQRWYEQHHTLTPEEQREALAHTLARELTRGATWHGVAGLKEQASSGPLMRVARCCAGMRSIGRSLAAPDYLL